MQMNDFSVFFQTLGASDSIRVTLIMSFWSTVLSAFVGIPMGLALEKGRFPGKRMVLRILRTLMGAPPVAIGLIAYMLLRRNGPLGGLHFLFTIKGMVFAQMLIIIPIICGMVHSYAASAAPSIRLFGKTMGADRIQTEILLIRELKREICFAVLTGYSRSISEVGAVFLVGGNIKNNTRTMTTAISTLKNAGEFQEGIMLGILLLLIAFCVQLLSDYLLKEDSEDENY